MLIAITGQKFCGKDTLAKCFVDYGFELARFADPLKEMIRAMYRCAGLTETEIERRIEGDLKEVPCELLGGKTPRYAMQTIGTEWRDMIDRNLWINQWLRKVTSTLADGGHVVVPDLRFTHEYNIVRSLGGHVLRVKRDAVGSNDLSGHISETEMSDIPADIVINNNGSLEELHGKARGAYIVLGSYA